MSGHWRKLGSLYQPIGPNRHEKLLTHAANPLPVLIEGDLYRVFYSGRDRFKRSSVGAVDIDLRRLEVVRDHPDPFFLHGPPGSFYADGVSIGNCYVVDGQRYMLFMGWQNPPGGHWRGDVGRLKVSDGLCLALDGEGPFMGSDTVDPLSLSYPWVLPRGDAGYDMWYGSTLAWNAGNGEMLHVIQHATSTDGHQWIRRGQAVPHEPGRAQAFSRPTVMPDGRGGFDMWFSYRGGVGEGYRIGYAFSDDGKEWVLDLQRSGIARSDEGWDSEMIEYPYVFEHRGARYMLYNGNGYGASGFGMAVLDD